MIKTNRQHHAFSENHPLRIAKHSLSVAERRSSWTGVHMRSYCFYLFHSKTFFVLLIRVSWVWHEIASHDETPALGFRGMWSTTLLPLLPGPLGVVVPVRVFSVGQIELFNHLTVYKQNLFAYQTCACVYSPTVFTILETTNELQQSILEALLIENTNWNYVSKSNPLITFLGHQKKTSLTVSTLLTKSNFFSICFFFTPPGFSFGYNPMLTSSSIKLFVIDNSRNRSDWKKGSPF